VIVLDALGAAPDPSLDALLGADRARRLRAALLERALRWAHALAGAGVHHLPDVEAATDALAAHDGPVVLVAPDVPGLDEALADAVRGDLADGCTAVVGAAHDSRPYVIALPRPTPAGLALAAGPLEGGAIAAAARAAEGLPGGLLLGLLRSERRLTSAADARALALDPLVPAELAPLLP
jgi:glycosyltransferase A (GT-A) superfamily protein (DUF2064 family)